MGDVTGIGSEVALKAIAAKPTDDTRYLLIGDAGHVRRINEQLALHLPLQPYSGPEQASRLCLVNPLSDPLPLELASGSPVAASAAVAWLADGAKRCLCGELDALVTAPVNKEAIVRAGHAFIGQTEFFARLAGTDRIAMMLLGHDDCGRWLRVALATTHVQLKFVAERLSQAKIEMVIELAAQACHDLGLPQARIGVCGLNPHAGEGGEFGDEEQTLIGPAIVAAQHRQLDAVGPLSADTLFHRALHGAYDAVVAMYHDQGLAPLKLVAFDTGVNWTLGLPFIRTSPDHGTAYDIAGQGIANPSSMTAAIRLARQLVANKRAREA